MLLWGGEKKSRRILQLSECGGQPFRQEVGDVIKRYLDREVTLLVENGATQERRGGGDFMEKNGRIEQGTRITYHTSVRIFPPRIRFRGRKERRVTKKTEIWEEGSLLLSRGGGGGEVYGDFFNSCYFIKGNTIRSPESGRAVPYSEKGE